MDPDKDFILFKVIADVHRESNDSVSLKDFGNVTNKFDKTKQSKPINENSSSNSDKCSVEKQKENNLEYNNIAIDVLDINDGDKNKLTVQFKEQVEVNKNSNLVYLNFTPRPESQKSNLSNILLKTKIIDTVLFSLNIFSTAFLAYFTFYIFTNFTSLVRIGAFAFVLYLEILKIACFYSGEKKLHLIFLIFKILVVNIPSLVFVEWEKVTKLDLIVFISFLALYICISILVYISRYARKSKIYFVLFLIISFFVQFFLAGLITWINYSFFAVFISLWYLSLSYTFISKKDFILVFYCLESLFLLIPLISYRLNHKNFYEIMNNQ